MLTIPLYIFLIIFLLYIAVLSVFLLINIYHILSTASFTLTSFLFTFFVFGSFILTIAITFQMLTDANVDWTMPVRLLDASWFQQYFGASTL